MNVDGSRRRAVITGTGCITPIGNGRKQFWNAGLRGDFAVAPIPDHWNRYFNPTIWKNSRIPCIRSKPVTSGHVGIIIHNF